MRPLGPRGGVGVALARELLLPYNFEKRKLKARSSSTAVGAVSTATEGSRAITTTSSADSATHDCSRSHPERTLPRSIDADQVLSCSIPPVFGSKLLR